MLSNDHISLLYFVYDKQDNTPKISYIFGQILLYSWVGIVWWGPI